jgi:hypothetical protein
MIFIFYLDTFSILCSFALHKRTWARILKHFKVAAEKIALGKVNFSNGILKQPDFSLTAVCHCCQKTYSLSTGLNSAVLVTLLERQLVCLRIPKMQVWLERYLFKRKVIFSTSMKCLRIMALFSGRFSSPPPPPPAPPRAARAASTLVLYSWQLVSYTEAKFIVKRRYLCLVRVSISI